VIKLKPGAIIGRSPKAAYILVDDEKVSGIHARIQVKEERFVVVDLGSANGTWVNDQEVTGPTVLKQDDTVRVGGTTFVLKTL
jgi:pSer/pThr/pTyr-binding forkhead associated (FHA) protein